jgi:hypothetical protein
MIVLRIGQTVPAGKARWIRRVSADASPMKISLASEVFQCARGGRPILHSLEGTYCVSSSVRARGNPVRRDFNVLAMLKGNERFVYVYDDDGRDHLVNVFRDQAADPNLSLCWLDVGVLVRKAREQAKAAAGEPPAESRI